MFGLFKPQSEQGLIAHWTFNEGTGAVAGDRKNAYNGTLINMEEVDWTAGKIGTALNFDGADERIEGITYSALNTTMSSNTVFSFSMWASASSFQAGDTAFCMGVLNSGSSTNTIIFRPYSTSNNGPRLFHNGGTALFDLAGPAADGAFNHFCYVQDGATDHTLYVNGSSVATSSTSTTMTSSFGEVTIAVKNDNANFYLGRIDDIRIYDRALTAAEVSKLANLGV